MSLRSKYLAFELTEASKMSLLELFRPSYSRVVCHHVTVELNLTESSLSLLQHDLRDAELAVVGYRLGDGVETLVVAVNHNPTRPDGRVYHITLSLEPGHNPKESNDLLAQQGWQTCIPVKVQATLRLLAK